MENRIIYLLYCIVERRRIKKIKIDELRKEGFTQHMLRALKVLIENGEMGRKISVGRPCNQQELIVYWKKKRGTVRMAKKTQDLKPDTVLKNYWSCNEQFADIFNAVLFEGKQVIRHEELEDVDTEESTVLEHKDYAESIEASRDNIKIRKRSSENGIEFVMLGKESQKHIHYAMPLRVMGYDYGTYKKQYDDNAAKYTSSQGMDSDEYLSRMKQTDNSGLLFRKAVGRSCNFA